MKMTTTRTEKPTTIVTLQTLAAAVAYSLVWGVGYNIVDALFGWIINRTIFTQILWGVVAVVTFVMTVIEPVLVFSRKIRSTSTSVETPAPARQLYALPDDIGSTELNRYAASKETLETRKRLTPDLNACFADSGFCWTWANSSSTTRVYVRDIIHSGISWTGELSCVDGRVESVSFVHNERGEIVLQNAPLLAEARKKQEEAEAPLKEFFAAFCPDAKWERTDSSDDTILVTSKFKGVKNVVGKIRCADDGTITCVTLMDGNSKKYIRAKSNTAGATKSSGATMTAENVRKKRTSKTKSVVESTAPTTAPVDTRPLAEETKAHLLHSPMENPPVPDDVLRRHARQQVEYDAAELSSIAMTVEENGDDSFVYKWPEGIQSQKEAEYFAEALVAGGGFRKVEVDAGKQTFLIYLAENDFDVME